MVLEAPRNGNPALRPYFIPMQEQGHQIFIHCEHIPNRSCSYI